MTRYSTDTAEMFPPRPPIVVTGPGGWIGTAFLATIADIYGTEWAKRLRLFGSKAHILKAPDGGDLEVTALKDVRGCDLEDAVVIHLAYLTKEKATQLGDRAFLDANCAIDDALLAALAGASPRAVFVASSGAAAQAELGSAHLYGLTKLIQEHRFQQYAATTGVPLLIGRIYNLSGPYINKVQSYAISSFLAQAYDTGTIKIDAKVPVYRSYLHVLDLCAIVLAMTTRGDRLQRPIDICGAQVVEMMDIAREVARIRGLDGNAITRDAVDYRSPSVYLGDPVPFRTAALKYGIELRDFATQVKDTAFFLEHNSGSSNHK